MVVGFAAVVGLMNLYVYFAPQWGSSSAAQEDSQLMRPQVLDHHHQHQQQQQGPLTLQRQAEEKNGVKGVGITTPSTPPMKRDATKTKNVLFIMTDDLRPSLSVYDKPVVSPAIDRLAAMGVVFERAYNQVSDTSTIGNGFLMYCPC